MKTWKARLAKDGARILCGWTNTDGRSGCNAVIAWTGDGEMEFMPFYHRSRPYNPDVEPLPLEIDAMARDRWARKQRPLPGRRRNHRPDGGGEAVLMYMHFPLPATAPCPGRRCGRQNLITAEMLAPSEPSE